MKELEKITVPRFLQKAFDKLVAAINQRTPKTGYGLIKNETENGVLIALESGKSGGGDSGPSIFSGQWQAITVTDQTCAKFTLVVWAQGPPTPQ